MVEASGDKAMMKGREVEAAIAYESSYAVENLRCCLPIAGTREKGMLDEA